MNINSLSMRHQVRQIQETDVSEVYELCRGNPIYYQHCGSEVSIDDIKNEMLLLPPGKRPEDKYYIGFYGEAGLVAVMDLIDGYPDQDTVYIGFFMMNQKLQGTGVGTNIIMELLKSFRAIGFSKVKLGYVKSNLQSEKFWLKNHFMKTGKETQEDEYLIVEMEYLL